MPMWMNIPQWNTLLAIDLNGDAVTFEIVQPPASGALEIVSEVRHIGRISWQWFKYTPSNNFVGIDTARYVATDSSGASDEATIKINVGQGEWTYKVYDVAATPPPGTYTTPVDVELTVPSIDPEWAVYFGQPAVRYTTDGSDPVCNDGTPSSTSQTVHLAASATLRARACYAYGYSSPVGEFVYTIEDPGERNQVPDAFHRRVETAMNMPTWNNLLGRDRDSEPLTFKVLDDLDYGSFTLFDHVTTTHWLSWVWGHYVPDRNFVGIDHLTYRVTDPHGATATETAEFVVTDRDWDFSVGPVTATPPSGAYVGTQLVALEMNTSTTPWGETSIWYTKDGSAPDCGSGLQYSSPISVPVDLTIRAIACYPFGYRSEVSDFSYLITEPAPTPGVSGDREGAPLPPPSFGSLPLPVFMPQVTAAAVAPRVLGMASCSPKPTPVPAKFDAALARRLGGRILLGVESCGDVWYVGPISGRRYKLPTEPATLLDTRGLVLKVTAAQLKQVAVGTTGLASLPARVASGLRGRFVQVAGGAVWYINPVDGRRYSVATAAELLAIVHRFSLGISNADLARLRAAE